MSRAPQDPLDDAVLAEEIALVGLLMAAASGRDEPLTSEELDDLFGTDVSEQ